MRQVKVKKLVTSMLAFLLLTVVVPPFLYTAEAATPRYIAINDFRTDLEISDSGSASCSTKVSFVYTTYTVEITMKLQRTSMTESQWTTIRTWTTTGSGTVAMDRVWLVNSGYFYRLIVTATVYDANGNFVETQTISSEVVGY